MHFIFLWPTFVLGKFETEVATVGMGWGVLSIYLKQDEFLSKELSHLDILTRLKEVKKTNPYGYLHNKSK